MSAEMVIWTKEDGRFTKEYPTKKEAELAGREALSHSRLTEYVYKQTITYIPREAITKVTIDWS